MAPLKHPPPPPCHSPVERNRHLVICSRPCCPQPCCQSGSAVLFAASSRPVTASNMLTNSKWCGIVIGNSALCQWLMGTCHLMLIKCVARVLQVDGHCCWGRVCVPLQSPPPLGGKPSLGCGPPGVGGGGASRTRGNISVGVMVRAEMGPVLRSRCGKAETLRATKAQSVWLHGPWGQGRMVSVERTRCVATSQQGQKVFLNLEPTTREAHCIRAVDWSVAATCGEMVGR